MNHVSGLLDSAVHTMFRFSVVTFFTFSFLALILFWVALAIGAYHGIAFLVTS